jgi:uncharacterized protein (DUF488 family)
MNLYTIGFTKKSAQQFFELLEKNKVNYMVDIRLNPTGQLAGFTKKEDLRYFLKELIDCDYIHLHLLAPTKDILTTYRKNKSWNDYERKFMRLMEERKIPYSLDKALFENNNCCLLCSEPTADHCHRRLVAELIVSNWSHFEIVHL